MLTLIAYAAFAQLYRLCEPLSVSSSKLNSSTGLVLAPDGSRARKRGIARPTYLASSDSRSERHAAYSGVWKILVRSRGLASSCHESIWNRLGELPLMNGQCAAAAFFASSPSSSTSGGLWSK